RQRQAEMAAVAAGLRFSYVAELNEAQREKFAELFLFRFGKRHRGLATHFMHGDLGGRPVSVMMYGVDMYPGGPSRNNARLRQTVLITHAPLTCPPLLLWPVSASGPNVVPDPTAGDLESTLVKLPLDDLVQDRDVAGR